MAALGLNIVISRASGEGGPLATRLDQVKADFRLALADLEELVRARAALEGVPEADLDLYAGVLVGLAARRAVESVLEEARRARATSRHEGRGTRDMP